MKEQELFDWLKAEKFPDLVHSPELYDGFDCTSAKDELFIELKSRKTHYPTLLIEKSKYDFLLDQSGSMNYKPLYINWTPDGIFSFDLLTQPAIEWAEKWLPSTTEFANKNNKMKLVGFLHTDNATKLI